MGIVLPVEHWHGLHFMRRQSIPRNELQRTPVVRGPRNSADDLVDLSLHLVCDPSPVFLGLILRGSLAEDPDDARVEPARPHVIERFGCGCADRGFDFVAVVSGKHDRLVEQLANSLRCHVQFGHVLLRHSRNPSERS